MLSGCWMGAIGTACADDARAKAKAIAIILIASSLRFKLETPKLKCLGPPRPRGSGRAGGANIQLPDFDALR
jgi:hypothetical protein